MNRELFLIRGMPGSGKSTLANLIADVSFSNDMFHTDSNGNYKFDLNRVPDAVNWCKNSVREAMRCGIEKIAVANTFTTESEMTDYFLIAQEYNYQVHSLIVENRHNNKSIHPVPEETLTRMRNRFEVKL